jgi:GT2 family glycosyltransferase
MKDAPEVSIIIVNWNVCALLEACLQSIRDHIGLDPSRFEVHIVDNDSSDNSVEMVREKFPEFHLRTNRENLGFGRANNQVFRECRGNYILLLNPDTEIQGDAVAKMLSIMSGTSDAGILGSRLINTDGSFQRSSGGALPTVYNIAWHYLLLNQLLPAKWAPLPTFMIEDQQGTFDIGWVSGAVMMIRREAIGDYIFDPRFFMYGEDLELCDRVQRDGWRVMYTAEATVKHHLRQSLAKQSSIEMLGRAVTGNRHYFQIRHGKFKTWLYDLTLTVGYVIRWVFFGIAQLFKSSEKCQKLVVTNGRYAWVSFKSLLRCGF